MENLKIYKSIDKDNKLIVVKTLNNFEEFKDGIRIFCDAPYNEKLTDLDCEKEYSLYNQNGIVFGCYVDNKLAGLNCILNDVPSDYSIDFYEKNKVAYYSGLAVKKEYRKQGFGKLLVYETEKYLEDLKIYDYSFARILCEGSMSEGIFKLNDFNDAYYNGKLIVDNVEYDRNDPLAQKTDKRKYMVKTINTKGSGWYKK